MLEYYRMELEKCKTLLSQINNATNILDNIVDEYGDLNNNLLVKYTVDDNKTNINIKVDTKRDKVDQISKHLKGVTVPLVYERIAFLQKAIAALLEEMARQAAAASTASGGGKR